MRMSSKSGMLPRPMASHLRKNKLKNIKSASLKLVFAFAIIFQMAQGAERNFNTIGFNSPMDNHGATTSNSFHSSWEVAGRGQNWVILPEQDPIAMEVVSKFIPPQLSKNMPPLKPACSILMDSGAQLDYVPGVVAVWILRDYNVIKQVTNIITGQFQGKDLYSFPAQEFAHIIMHTQFFNACRPLLVTYAHYDGEFPINHPEHARQKIIETWFNPVKVFPVNHPDVIRQKIITAWLDS